MDSNICIYRCIHATIYIYIYIYIHKYVCMLNKCKINSLAVTNQVGHFC